MMKKFYYLAMVLVLYSFSAIGQTANLNYTVNLNDRSGDTFKVTLNVSGLSAENDIYQFASTAPGTYQTMNLGRFVSNFKAYDKKGREIETEKVSDNQWKLGVPKKVKQIKYEISETWDIPVEEFPVYRMCGTSLEDDHALINPHAVLGYPKGMQKEPLTISFEYPEQWKVGTALNLNENGVFYANNYDHAVDSPILFGRLTYAKTNLDGNPIEIYTYSKTDKIQSEQLMESMTEMLKSADEFIVDFPVDRYTFLFHFEDLTYGAWEHSYSSEYVIQEQDFTPEFGQGVTDIAAHEFFHVITPLNIHSEIVQYFNFVTPTPSEHLWLYEGTTEWAARIMQLRSGLISLEQYLGVLQEKMYVDNIQYDPDYSLSQLALNSYTKEGQTQYGNIYMRGALVPGLLDILLLEKSGGTKGYRELIYELSQKYGPDKPFDEKNFIREITELTYPEVGDFFEKYVKNANPLPMEEYYAKIGITYIPEIKGEEEVPTVGGNLGVPDGKLRFVNLHPDIIEMGLQLNDELIGYNGEEVTLNNVNQLLGGLLHADIGFEYEVTVRRGEEELNIPLKILSQKQVQKFVFLVDENASESAVKLREAWMRNFDINKP